MNRLSGERLVGARDFIVHSAQLTCPSCYQDSKMKQIIFLSLLICRFFAVQSQDSLTTLQQVVVTANKYPVKASHTGKVVTIISNEQIRQSGSRDLSQLLTEQAGVFINGAYSNAGKDKSVYVRGARPDHTLITINGIPVYDPSGVGSNFDLRLLSIDQVERVEILKGSQSTLYGSDAVAGVINIILKSPGCSEKPFSGMISHGSFGTWKAHASLTGSVQKLNYHLSYAGLKSDGISEAADTSKGNNTPADRDSYRQSNVHISLGYNWGKHLRTEAYYRLGQFYQRYDQGSFREELDLSSKNDNHQAGLRGWATVGKGKFNFAYNFNDNRRLYIDDSIISRNGYDKFNRGVYNGKEHFADAYWVLNLKKYYQVTLGVDYRNSISNQEYISISDFGNYESKLGADSLHQNQISAYGSVLATLPGGMNLELGGRFNRHSAYGGNWVYNFNPSYVLNGQWKFYANLSTAFRTPSLFQLYSDFGNANLKPERARNIEGGLQYAHQDRKLQLRVTWFDRVVRDNIIFFTDPITYRSNYINRDRQHDQGLEAEGSCMLARGLLLTINSTYADGRLSTKTGEKDTSYFNLLRRPRFSLAANLGWNPCKKWRISTGLIYVGKREDLSFDANYNAVAVQLKSYYVLNAYAEYHWNLAGTRFFLEAKNFLNQSFTEIYGFNSLGRNISGGLRVQF